MRLDKFKVNGGGRGIRTPARFNPPVGFQDRSLQPDLGIPPYRQELIYHILNIESTKKQNISRAKFFTPPSSFILI
jgi:hypothetical protein